jgi:hypothetical protein
VLLYEGFVPILLDLTLLIEGRTESVARLNDLSAPQAKVTTLPEARWRSKPS